MATRIGVSHGIVSSLKGRLSALLLGLLLWSPLVSVPAAGLAAITSSTRVLTLSTSALAAKAGGTINLGMRFNAVPTAEDYQVFVHFINSTGAITLGADHAPPTPTSRWSGAVNYTRSVTLPSSMASGTYSIRVGLYQNHFPYDRVTLKMGTGVTTDGALRYTVGTLKVGATATAPSPSPSPSPTPSALPNEVVVIASGALRSGLGSGFCLDIPGESTLPGTALAIWTCNGGSNQSFLLDSKGQLKSFDGNSNLCLDIKGSGSNLDPIISTTCNGTASQRWSLVNDTLISASSGRCIDVKDELAAEGTPVILYDCGGSPNQKWLFVNVASPSPSSPPIVSPIASPAPVTSPSPVPTSPTSATGRFYVVGKDIVDPAGRKFLPIGANVGVNAAFDWQGVGTGRSVEAVAWNWNTVRLTVYCSDVASWTTKATQGYAGLLSQVDGFVQEYTGRKIVVMIECHDDLSASGPSGTVRSQLDQFWTDMAIKYKANPYVWFNPMNEPEWSDNSAWVSLQQHYLALIRSKGAENVFVADLMNTGQDAGWDGALKVYDPSMGPKVNSGQCNVLFSLHAYGGIGDQASYATYLDRVQSANLPLIVGETGYTINGTSTAGDYSSNVTGTNAIFNLAPAKGIGILWWHATHGDHYSLRSSGGPFYERGIDGRLESGLSTAGQRFWDISHNLPDLGAFTGPLRSSNCASAAGL